VEGVREARAADVERCSELLAEAIDSVRSQRGGGALLASQSDTADPRRLVERWRADPACRLLVGTFEDAVVGLGAGSLVDGHGGRLGRIECCYVEPGARAVGVGQGIIEDLVDWFAHHGCLGVDAVALPGDRSSKQLLEASGFKARLLVLHRSLG
jgi:GNAT superfamily N-acetyltransferase